MERENVCRGRGRSEGAGECIGRGGRRYDKGK